VKAPILLVAAGPTQHTPALQRGFDLARTSASPIHVCLFVHDLLIERSGALVGPEVMQLARRQFMGERRQWLDALAARWTADGLSVTAEVVWAPVPHEAIVTKALDLEPWVVIKDIGHESAMKRLMYSALDWKLLRYCPAPLMLVHETSGHLPGNILAAVDTAAEDGRADALNELIMAEALRHSGHAAAQVHAAHAFPYPALSSAFHRTLDRIYASVRQKDFAAFQAFVERHGVNPKAQHWLEGQAPGQLGQLIAREEIDLLVLGSAYRSSADRLLLGSTAEMILAQASCDVLVVKPKGFAAELASHVDLDAWRLRCSEATEHADPVAA
jgi:universal stress protein E